MKLQGEEQLPQNQVQQISLLSTKKDANAFNEDKTLRAGLSFGRGAQQWLPSGKQGGGSDQAFAYRFLSVRSALILTATGRTTGPTLLRGKQGNLKGMSNWKSFELKIQS